jgi:DNA-binding NtrC family response regulator
VSEKSSNEILVILDDDAIQNMLNIYFSGQLPQYLLVSFETKEDGLHYLDEHLPCFILMQSHEMRNEYDTIDSTAQQINEQERTKHIPVLILIYKQPNYQEKHSMFEPETHALTIPFDIEHLEHEMTRMMKEAKEKYPERFEEISS